jgi:hypothetical protein
MSQAFSRSEEHFRQIQQNNYSNQEKAIIKARFEEEEKDIREIENRRRILENQRSQIRAVPLQFSEIEARREINKKNQDENENFIKQKDAQLLIYKKQIEQLESIVNKTQFVIGELEQKRKKLAIYEQQLLKIKHMSRFFIDENERLQREERELKNRIRLITPNIGIRPLHNRAKNLANNQNNASRQL